MVRKLKVFQTQLGFYESVIAVPSQAAALEAWGTRHNLFADGMARPATDEKAIEAALQQPGITLKRAIGSSEPFSLNPGLPRLPDLPDPPAKRTSKVLAAPAKREPADRAALDRAEADLRRLVEERHKEEQTLRTERQALDDEEQAIAERRKKLKGRVATAKDRYDAALSKAEREADRERKAYERAAGR